MNSAPPEKDSSDSVSQRPSRCPFAPWVEGHPLLGNSLAFLRDTTGFLLRAHEKHGSPFRIRMLWLRFTVLLGFEARDFMKSGGERHLTRHPVFDPVGEQLGASDFALAISGEKHMQLRPLLQMAYSREIASPFVPDFIESTRRIIRGWKAGQAREVFESVQEIAFEQYCQVMGRASFREQYADCRKVTDMNMEVGGRVLPLWLFRWPPYRAARRRVLKLMWAIVEQRRNEAGSTTNGAPPPRPDIIDTLMSVRFPDGRPMTNDEVVCYAMYGFAGSCSYMGRLISFMLHEILTRPELMAALTREVDEAFSAGFKDSSDVARMRLLRGVYLETLRFRPVSQGMPYVAKEDFEFQGRTVRKGDMVVLSQLPTLFADPPFKNPRLFDPSRCMEPRNEHRKGGAFNPFGMHHRTCAATGLVELMAMTQVATLLHEFDLEMVPGDYQLRMTVKPLPAPDRRFRMRPTPRAKPAPPAPAEGLSPLREEVYLAAFPGAEDPDVASALKEAHFESFAPGTSIIKQGDTADKFYVIAEGRVQVIRESSGGESKILAELGSGECFGEIGLLLGIPRTATVRVSSSSPVKTLTMPAPAFRKIVAASDMVSSEITRVVRRRTAGQRIREWIATHSLESGLSRLRGFTAATLQPNTCILREGDQPDRFHLIWQGSATVLRRDPDSAEQPVAELTGGDYFGETGLLNRSPRNATVVTSGDSNSILLSCDRAEFEHLVLEAGGRDGDLAWSLVRRLHGE